MGDIVIIIIYCVILFVSITLNISLLTLIVIATPRANRNFSIFLISHTVFDILITLSTFSNMGRILILDMHLVWIMHGPYGIVSTRLCYLGFDGYLTGVCAVFYINLCSFFARLLILRNGFISRRRVILLLLVLVAPHVTALSIFFATAQIPDEEARKLIEVHVPQYSYERTIIASSHLFSPAIAYTLFYVCVLIYPAMLGFWKLRSITIRELSEKGKQMSSATRNLHHTFVRVLTYQSMVPMIFVLAASLFIVVQLCEWRQPAAESVSMMIAEMPAIVSAIINLTCIPTYRRFLFRWIFRKSSPFDLTRVNTASFLKIESSPTVHSPITVKASPRHVEPIFETSYH